MRAVWTITEFSDTALTTRSGPTISITKACRAGLSNAVTRPRANTSPRTIHVSTPPESVRTHNATAGIAMRTAVTISSRRFGKRSASRPPHAPSRRMGRNCRAAVRPTAKPECVSCTMSHISATVCIQLPEMETTWPAK
jgi:hypothetical protein